MIYMIRRELKVPQPNCKTNIGATGYKLGWFHAGQIDIYKQAGRYQPVNYRRSSRRGLLRLPNPIPGFAQSNRQFNFHIACAIIGHRVINFVKFRQ